jgi:tetratricopeptide (TPR) repeat protein
VTLFATSNLVVHIGATFAERFLYTPSFGFAIAVGALLTRRLDSTATRSPRVLFRQHPLAAAILAILLLGYSTGTLARNRDWRSNLALFQADIARVGNSARAQYNLGTALYNEAFETAVPARQAALTQEALGHLRRAVTIYPPYPDALHNLAQAFILAGQPDSAAARFRGAIARDSTYAAAYLGLGLIRSGTAPAEAVEALEHYVSLKPDEPGAWQALGRSYANLGRPGPALAAMERALALAPGDLGTLKDLGAVYGMAGRLEESLEILLRALDQDPEDPALLGNIAVTYRRLGNEAKFEEFDRRARAAGS